MKVFRNFSKKKTRFSCKKITFLELLRFRRDQVTRAVTERKRLEKILFLPQVKREVDGLTPESIQRILHQGGLFHFCKEVSIEPQDSLDRLLYGDIVNVKCLSCHDLILLLSLLLKFFKGENVRLIFRVLEQCSQQLRKFSPSELSHISYWLCRLPQPLKNNVGRALMLKIAKICNGTNLKIFSDISNSIFAKLAYSLSEFELYDFNLLHGMIRRFSLSEKDRLEVSLRNSNLIASAMVKYNLENYEFLRDVCDFLSRELSLALEKINNNKLVLDGLKDRNIIYSLDAELYQRIDVKNILSILKASEYFGYNNKKFLKCFNDYINAIIQFFISNNYNRKPLRKNLSGNVVELMKSGLYKRKNDKHDIQRLLSELKLDKDDLEFWDLETVISIGKRRMTRVCDFSVFLRKFLDTISVEKLSQREFYDLKCLCDLHNVSLNMYNIKNFCGDLEPEDLKVEAVDPNLSPIFHQSILFNNCYRIYTSGKCNEMLEEMVRFFHKFARDLPEVKNWPCVFKMVKVISMSKITKLLIIVRSFMEESYLNSREADEILLSMPSIFVELLAKPTDATSKLMEIESCLRIIEICIEANLGYDLTNLGVFVNLSKLLVETNKTRCLLSDENSDIFLHVMRLEDILMDYLVSYSISKTLDPNEEISRETCETFLKVFCHTLAFPTHERDMSDFVHLLNDINHNSGGNKIVDKLKMSNNEIFRHLLYQTLLINNKNTI